MPHHRTSLDATHRRAAAVPTQWDHPARRVKNASPHMKAKIIIPQAINVCVAFLWPLQMTMGSVLMLAVSPLCVSSKPANWEATFNCIPRKTQEKVLATSAWLTTRPSHGGRQLVTMAVLSWCHKYWREWTQPMRWWKYYTNITILISIIFFGGRDWMGKFTKNIEGNLSAHLRSSDAKRTLPAVPAASPAPGTSISSSIRRQVFR